MHKTNIFAKIYKKITKKNLINIINVHNIKHYDFENPEILTVFIGTIRLCNTIRSRYLCESSDETCEN